MNADNLIHMANRIGQFFEAMPERDEALEGIANHLQKFWDPRRRRQFLALVDDGRPEISDIVRLAMQAHRQRVMPTL